MKTTGIACLLSLILQSQSAWSLSAPTDPKVINQINTLLQRATELQETLTDNQGRNVSISRYEQELAPLMTGVDPSANQAEIARINAVMQPLKDERDRIMREAILATLVAYGVVPNQGPLNPVFPQGTTVYPSFDKRKVFWVVRYGDKKDGYVVDNNGKKYPVKAKDPSDYDANMTGGGGGGFTSPDGVTELFGTFSSSAMLALNLFHEQVHFTQYTTFGKGDKLIKPERELEAYKLEAAEIGSVGLSRSERIWMKGFIAKEIHLNDAQAKGITPWMRMKITIKGPLAYDAAYNPTSHTRTPDEIDKIIAETQELDEQIRREAEERRSADEKAAATLSAAALERQGSLEELARKACWKPDSLQEDDMQRLLRWFPYENRNEGVLHHPQEEPTDEMSRCMYDLIKEILDINGEHGNVDLGWVKDHARALSPFYQYPVDDLAAIADKACRGPDSIGDYDLQSVLWFPKPNKLSRTAFAYPVNDPREQGYYRCKVELYRRMRALNDEGGKLTLDWIRDNARWLEPPVPPPAISRPEEPLKPQPPSSIPSPTPSDSPSSGGYIDDEPSRPERGGCAEPDPKTGIIGCPKKR